MKLHLLSSIFEITRNRFHRENKVEMIVKKKSLNKKEILQIFKTFTNVIPKKINSLNVKKNKFSRGVDLPNKNTSNPYVKLSQYKRVISYKKIIITFEHSKNKITFLSDLGIN